ncbi:hypothetical protein FIBSPDRAFT_847329 [Athelia psychrophila]|uniref:Yeast cell wall synthesis Kre9/Knh1-like N-terminal domain-containing protein n=1 Tax=Athelia psychrophila TaxID=1759441 RepID=A0A166W612_9AGAM|nr:hypothetical protein FIBSPDRAFT_847329 [Fibularhizoctonia sp. CBS 109695]
MMMTPFTILFALLSFFALALGSPITLQSRDVYVPPVTYPHAGTVWVVGQHHNVTWDTKNHPVNITNSIGQVVLAKNGIQDYKHPLASGFNILDGHVTITVPKVATGSKYAIVLFGDSGNYSPTFTINAA